MIILIVIIYFWIKLIDKYTKDALSIFIGTGVGCGAVIVQGIIGVGTLALLVLAVKSCG